MKAFMRMMASISAVFASASSAFSDTVPNGDGAFGHMMWGGGHGWWGGFGMILFWGLIIAVAVFAFRALTNNWRGETRDSMEILKERYARGEIDEDEFRRRKQELQS